MPGRLRKGISSNFLVQEELNHRILRVILLPFFFLYLVLLLSTAVHSFTPIPSSTSSLVQRPIHLPRNSLSSQSKAKPKTNLKMSVGFIGLGIMGEGMAARLLTQSITGTTDSPLYIWNRTKSKCTDFKEKYSTYNIIVKDTAKEVVESASTTYCMLSTPEASKAVFEAEDGVLAGISDGKNIVDCATLAEADMVRMNEAVMKKGGVFLEAPVSGSKAPAANGQLIFLCAGSKTLFDSIVDNGLNAMGKASHFFSETVGFGTRAKLVVNSLMGTMVAAFSEALALAENTGLDPSKMIEVIGQGAIQVCYCMCYELLACMSLFSFMDYYFTYRHTHPCPICCASNLTEPCLCIEGTKDGGKGSCTKLPIETRT